MTLLCICILFMVRFDQNPNEDWPQLGHDPLHTYLSETQIPRFLETLWQYQMERGNGYPKHYERSPAVVGDRVFLFDSQTLYCLAFQTGELLYKVPAFSPCSLTPTVANGKVYLATREDLFQCLDAETGGIIWEKELPGLYKLSPLVSDTLVYVTVERDPFTGWESQHYCWAPPQWYALVALDRETGREMWRYSTADEPVYAAAGMGFPVLAEGHILFHLEICKDEESCSAHRDSCELVCLDAQTGTVIWRHEGALPSSFTEFGSVAPFWITYNEGRLYMVLKGYVLAVDMKTQTTVWEYQLPQGWEAPLAVGHGMVVVRGLNRVSCLDAVTGRELWEVLIRGESTLPALTKSEVFVGSAEGILYRLDIKTGKIKESYRLGSSVYSPVVANGCVLVVTDSNCIYCLGQISYYKIVFSIAAILILLMGLLFLKRARSRT